MFDFFNKKEKLLNEKCKDIITNLKKLNDSKHNLISLKNHSKSEISKDIFYLVYDGEIQTDSRGFLLDNTYLSGSKKSAGLLFECPLFFNKNDSAEKFVILNSKLEVLELRLNKSLEVVIKALKHETQNLSILYYNCKDDVFRFIERDDLNVVVRDNYGLGNEIDMSQYDSDNSITFGYNVHGTVFSYGHAVKEGNIIFDWFDKMELGCEFSVSKNK